MGWDFELNLGTGYAAKCEKYTSESQFFFHYFSEKANKEFIQFYGTLQYASQFT